MLDFLFLFPTFEGGKIRLATDAAARLDSYIAQNADLLVPGVRLYLIDEMYLAATLAGGDGPVEYQAQLDDLMRGIALVRKKLPTAKMGISFSPHATFDKPGVMPFIRAAIAQVDWVGTTNPPNLSPTTPCKPYADAASHAAQAWAEIAPPRAAPSSCPAAKWHGQCAPADSATPA